MDLVTGALIAGYPVLGGAVAVLWRAYLSEKKKREETEKAVLAEKDAKIKELEEFRKIVEARWKKGDKP